MAVLVKAKVNIFTAQTALKNYARFKSDSKIIMSLLSSQAFSGPLSTGTNFE